jgi:ribosomal protein S18 acetylase RimI-like enzyme
MGDVIYRRAVPADAGTLAAARAAFLREVGPGDTVDGILVEAMRSYFAETLSNGEFAAVVATVDGEVIATSGMAEHRNPPSPRNPFGRSGYIMNMYTVPAWRNRGIASTILRKLLELASEKGYSAVSLHALPGAQSLYSKAGFEPVDNGMQRKLAV